MEVKAKFLKSFECFDNSTSLSDLIKNFIPKGKNIREKALSKDA